MSSPPQIEPFRGSGTWEECSDFIRAIRAAAWKEGKLRDLAWMADFASLNFSHKALFWHSRLPEDVRQDWSKLESEIFIRWAPLEGDDGVTIRPTPAAAPALDHNETNTSPLQGVLKVVLDESDTTYYVKFGQADSQCSLTNDANEALRVRCNSLPSGTLLECIGHSCHSWLAIQWDASAPTIGVGSSDYAYIPRVDSDMKSSRGQGCPVQLITCTILKSGEIILGWKKDGGSKAILTIFVRSGRDLYLAADPSAYSKQFPIERRAKLFIERTNHAN